MRDASSGVDGGGTAVEPCGEAGASVGGSEVCVAVNVACGMTVLVNVVDANGAGVKVGMLVLVARIEG